MNFYRPDFLVLVVFIYAINFNCYSLIIDFKALSRFNDFVIWFGFLSVRGTCKMTNESYPDSAFRIAGKGLKNYLLAFNNAEYIYEGLKAIPILILVWLLFIWIDFFRARKKRINRLFVKIADGIYTSFIENKKYLLDLGKINLLTFLSLILIQFIFCGYFLLSMPFNYDEFWSYLFFSGESYWATLSFYPVPNNHIFFNLVSGTFIRLPFNVEVMLRLPNLIASIITIYYFFKICKTCFSNTISLILIACIITCYPFTIYSFLARGYMFVCLFYVLLIYTSIKLFENYKNKKYRYLLILSLVLGLLSVPTFLYALLPVVLILFIYLFKQKRFSDIFLFIKDGIVSLLLAAGGYLFILIFNPPKNLLSPDVPKFSITDAGSFNLIWSHIKETGSFFMINETFILVLAVSVIISSIYYIIKTKARNNTFVFYPVLCSFLRYLF